MPSESASIMKKAYQELIQLTEKAVFLTTEEEEKIQAEIEVRFGLSPNRAKRMIDNMVKTGRVQRHASNQSGLDMRLITGAKEKAAPKLSKKEMAEVEARLQTKPGGKK